MPHVDYVGSPQKQLDLQHTRRNKMKYLVTWIESYEYNREIEANSEDEAIDKMAENCGKKDEFTGWQEIDYEQTRAEEYEEEEVEE